VENVGELFGAGVVAALGDLVTLPASWRSCSDGRQPLAGRFAVLPLLLITAMLFRRFMRQAMRQVRARLAGAHAFVAERLAGMTEVRLARKADSSTSLKSCSRPTAAAPSG
jgi:ATP-binding cassette subfamily B protein